jgi:DnaJ-class molecular chaperone
MDIAKFKARIEQIHADLERYSYYELLNLPREAEPRDIQRAFHRMAYSMHPDRFQLNPDAALRDKLYAVYKRIAEGYRVLMKIETRREYDLGLASGQLRLVKTERKKTGPKPVAEVEIDNPRAKRFFTLGLEAERRGDLKAARLNYQLAKNLLGSHPQIEEKIRELDAKLAPPVAPGA